MPITCPVAFDRLTTEEFGRLDYAVMAHAFACHNELGRLADESIYQADFSARLTTAGHTVHREVPITASFQSFSKTYRLDLVVDVRGIYELKTVSRLTTEHVAQLMNYLLMLDSSRGKVINFRNSPVESQFVNAPLIAQQRRAFHVEAQRWVTDLPVRDLIVELLRDWGTALELPLYRQAIVHLLGGEEAVTRQLPLYRDKISLGNQRFHLVRPGTALRVTTLPTPAAQYEQHIQRLLNHSPLKAMHWVNIARDQVSFVTVR